MTWTQESIIAELRRFHDKHGYQPVSEEASRAYGLPSCDTVIRIFGSWNEAITAAGFRPYPSQSSAQAKTMAHLDRNGVTA